MIRALQPKPMLKQAGLKITGPRLSVLGALIEATSPLSAPQIHGMLETELDRATVYRVLEAFADSGLVARLRHGERAHSYHLLHDSLRPRHPHFYCTSCGESSCLKAEAVEVDLSALGSSFPARIENLEISLEGICPSCLSLSRE